MHASIHYVARLLGIRRHLPGIGGHMRRRGRIRVRRVRRGSPGGGR